MFGLWTKLDLDRDGKPDTLEDALGYQGAKGLLGLKRKLMKAAVMALLNEAEYGDWYPAYESEDELIHEVNHVFRSKKRWKMKQLTKELRLWNDGYRAL